MIFGYYAWVLYGYYAGTTNSFLLKLTPFYLKIEVNKKMP